MTSECKEALILDQHAPRWPMRRDEKKWVDLTELNAS
jgi:hypothetical protein